MNRGPKATRPEDTVVGNMPKKRLKVLLRLGKYMFRFRWGYLLALALSVLSNLLSLVGPKLSGRAIDAIGTVPGQVDFEEVVRTCLLMLAAYAVSSVMAYLLQLVMINLSRGIVRRMREDIFAKLMKMKVGGTVHMHKIMEREESDDVVSGIISDMNSKGLPCRLSGKRELKTYSPSASVYVIDIIRE